MLAQQILFRESDLDAFALARLNELVFTQTFAPGTPLPEALVMIIEGEATISPDGDELPAPQTFGEPSLIDPATRTNARATTVVRAYILDGPAYDQFAKEFPESAFKLQQSIARRLLEKMKKAQTNLRLLYSTFAKVS